MKKLLLILLLIPTLSFAQSESNSQTASSSTCVVSNTACTILPISGTQNTILFNITGTWSATNQFEFSPDNQVTWRALSVVNAVSLLAVTSTTATGTFVATNPGYTHVRVRTSAFSSGTILVLIRAIQNNSIVGINFGGGGSTIGSVTQGAASDASANWLVNCAVGCSAATSDPDDASIAAGQTNSNSNALNMLYNGSAWVRMTLGQAAMAASIPVALASNQSSIPVAATLTAETTKVIGTVNISAAQTIAAVTAITNALPAGTNAIGKLSANSGVDIGDVDVTSVPADPFGANADAASATGSISAKLRYLASTGIPTVAAVTAITNALPAGTNAIGKLAANSGVDIGDVDVTSLPALPAGTNAIGKLAANDGVDIGDVTVNNLAPTTSSTDALSPCYHVTTASTNSINCKASVGNFFGFRAVNTTSTLAYLRLYNLASAPTCSSATGFIETIPIPHSTGTGGGLVSFEYIPTNYSTGIGFCVTGGGTSTDNTNAVAGVYIKIVYK